MNTNHNTIQINSQHLAPQKLRAQPGQALTLVIDGVPYTGQKQINGKTVQLVRQGKVLKIVIDEQAQAALVIEDFFAAPAAGDSAQAQLLSADDTLALLQESSAVQMAAAPAAEPSLPQWGTMVAQSTPATTVASTTPVTGATTATAAVTTAENSGPGAGTLLLGALGLAAVAAGGGGGSKSSTPAPAPTDTTAPTVTVTDNVTGTASGAVTYIIAFSETVSGFTASKVSASAGTLSGFTASADGKTYTIVLTPPANASGSAQLSINTTGVTDAAGNAAVAPTVAAQTYDTVPTDTTVPTVTVTDNVPGTASGAVTFTIAFSETVSGFNASKLALTGGTLSGFAANADGKTYTVVATPDAAAAGTLKLSVSTNGVSDAAGNAAVAPAVAEQAYVQNVLQGSIVAGPVIAGNQLSVKVFNSKLEVIGASAVDATGNYKVALGNYYGPVVVLVVDADNTKADYVDEVSKKPIDLSGELLVAGNVLAGNAIQTLNINPITTVGALKAGVKASADGTSVQLSTGGALQTSGIDSANAAVAKAMGLGTTAAELLTANIVPTVNVDGTANANANTYGKMLAVLAGMDATNGGDASKTFTALVDGISDTGTVTATVQSAMVLGANAASVPTSALPAGTVQPGGGGGGVITPPAPTSTIINGTVVLGPVIAGHGLTVKAYDLNGVEKGTAVVDSAGNYSINLGTYTGGVVLKVIDADGNVDYRDEATGATKDIVGTIMAVDNITSLGTITINLNAVTTLASVKAGLAAADGTGAVSGADVAAQLAKIAEVNTQVATALGLGSSVALTRQTAVATINSDGSANSTANILGKVLATFSQMDSAQGGSVVNTITTLANALTGSALSNAAATTLVTAAAKVGVDAGAITAAVAPATSTTGFTAADTSSLTPLTASLLTQTQIASIIAAGQLGNIPAAALQALNPTALQAAFAAATPAKALVDLTDTQLSSLSGAQLAALGGATGAGLTALNATQLGQLGADQIKLLSSAQVQALVDAGKLGFLSDIGALNATAVSGLSTDALNSLDTNALNALNATQIAAIATAGKLSAITNLAALGTDITGLSAQQIAALNDTQLGALNATQIAALATAGKLASLRVDLLANPAVNQIAALGDDIAGINAGALANFSTTQLEGLTATQIGLLASATPSALTSLTAPQIVALGTDITGLTAGQVKLLNAVQLGAITSAQADALATAGKLSALTATEIILLSGTAIDSVPTSGSGAITLLNPDQVKDLSDTQLLGLTKNQVSALATAGKLSALTDVKIAALGGDINGLDANQVNALGDTQLLGLTKSQIGALANDGDLSLLTGAKLRAVGADISGISADQARLLTNTQLTDLDATQIGALAADGDLALLTGAQITALGNDITGLTADQVSALTGPQLGGIDSNQADALAAAGDFANLTAANIGALSAAAIDSVPTDVITRLGPQGVAALTLAQVQALTGEQLAALNNAGLLDDLTQPLLGAQVTSAATVGLGLTGIDTADKLALFNDAVQTASGTTALDLAAIATGVAAVQAAVSGGPLTLVNLQALGLTGASEANLAAITRLIDATSAGTDGSLVNSINELKAIVANASGEFGGVGGQAAVNAAELSSEGGTVIAVGIPSNLVAGNTIRLRLPGTSGGIEQVIDYILTSADITQGYAPIQVTQAQALASGDGVKAVTFDSLQGATVVATAQPVGSFDIEAKPLTASLLPLPASTHRIDTDFSITFSRTIAKGTGAITLYQASDDSVVESFDVASSTALTWSGTTLTINPSANLASGQNYYVKVSPTAVNDIYGNTYAGIADKTSWAFTGSAISTNINPIAVDNTVNSAENAGAITISGSLNSVVPELLSDFSNSDFTVTLTAVGKPTVTLSNVTYTYTSGNPTGTWSGSVAAGTLQDAASYTVSVSVNGTAPSTTNTRANNKAIVLTDLQGPAAPSLTAASLKSGASASGQSTEVGALYLVKDGTTISLSNLESLVSAGTAVTAVKKATAAAANANATFGVAGLLEGDYHLYAADTAGNLSGASSSLVKVDNTAPTPTVANATIQSSASASVQSTETGTAYLAKSTITVNTLTDITSAANNQWKSLTLSSANANATLPAAGLIDGDYKLYTVDAAGNLSGASANTVVIDNTAPMLLDSGISISGATGTGGTYIVGDTVIAVVSVTDTNMVGNQGSVSVDFSALGGGASVAAVYQTTGVNTGKWVATYLLAAGTLNGTANLNVKASATDAAGNTVANVSDTTNAKVDNVRPNSMVGTIATRDPAAFFESASQIKANELANGVAVSIPTSSISINTGDRLEVGYLGTDGTTFTSFASPLYSAALTLGQTAAVVMTIPTNAEFTNRADGALNVVARLVDANGNGGANSNSLALTIATTGGQTIVGTNAVNYIRGGLDATGGNDTIRGNGGNDIINLGTTTLGGRDTLQYHRLNATDGGGNGNDVVTGFTLGNTSSNLQADVLSLGNLINWSAVTGLVGSPNNAQLASAMATQGFINLQDDGSGNLQVQVDIDGAANSGTGFAAMNTIATLQGLTTANISGADLVSKLTTLLTDGNLSLAYTAPTASTQTTAALDTLFITAGSGGGAATGQQRVSNADYAYADAMDQSMLQRQATSNDGSVNQATATNRLTEYINQVTGTDIVSNAEYTTGFSITGHAAAGAAGTIKFFLDNDRTTLVGGGAQSANEMGVSLVNSLSLDSGTGKYTANFTGGSISYDNGTGDYTITFAANSAALKPVTAATHNTYGVGIHQLTVDTNGNGARNGTGQNIEASRLFLVADGTANNTDTGIVAQNYSVQDNITRDVFVYYYGDPDGTGIGLWTQKNSGSKDQAGAVTGTPSAANFSGWDYYNENTHAMGDASTIANTAMGYVSNLPAQVWEFHAASGATTAIWSSAVTAATTHTTMNSNTSRQMSASELMALYAANFGADAGGGSLTSGANTLSTHASNRVGAIQPLSNTSSYNGVISSEDNTPGGWGNNGWSAAPTPSGHAVISFYFGGVFDELDSLNTYVPAVL